MTPAEGNFEPLSPSYSSWCTCSVQALWALKSHFMEFVPHPGLLCHSTSPAHSDLRAEKEPVSCPRSAKVPAAWESPSVCSHGSLSTSLLLHVVWLGLLLLQDHEDPVYLLLNLYSPPPRAPLRGCPVPHGTALSWGRPWGRLWSPPPSGLWLLI